MFNFAQDSARAQIHQNGAFGVNSAPHGWTFFFDNNYVLIVAAL